MSRVHAHRMIAAADFLEKLKTLPRGNVLPQTEEQVCPLLRLHDSEQQVRVWASAVEQADGGQPSAPQVSRAVFEVLHPEGPTLRDSPASRSQQRVELVSQLREGVRKMSWKQVERLLTQLETLM